MIGLQGAGKTALLDKVRADYAIDAPSCDERSSVTIGPAAESLELADGFSLHWCDLGCSDRVAPIWRQHAQDAVAVILVVDASSPQTFLKARDDLRSVLAAAGLKPDCKIIVAANKQDLPGALSGCQVASAMGLGDGSFGHWSVVGTSASSGTGLPELLATAGLDKAEAGSDVDSTPLPRMRPGSSQRCPSLSRRVLKGMGRWSLRAASESLLL